jgi:hypothetical protein
MYDNVQRLLWALNWLVVSTARFDGPTNREHTVCCTCGCWETRQASRVRKLSLDEFNGERSPHRSPVTTQLLHIGEPLEPKYHCQGSRRHWSSNSRKQDSARRSAWHEGGKRFLIVIGWRGPLVVMVHNSMITRWYCTVRSQYRKMLAHYSQPWSRRPCLGKKQEPYSVRLCSNSDKTQTLLTYPRDVQVIIRANSVPGTP